MSAYDLLKKQATDFLAQAMGRTAEAAPDAAAGDHAFFTEVIQMVQSRGLGNLAQTFQEKGLGELVNSWIGHGVNLPISASQLTAALGPQQIEALAKKLGLPMDQVSGMLSQVLPQLVDKLTPNGRVEDPAAD